MKTEALKNCGNVEFCRILKIYYIQIYCLIDFRQFLDFISDIAPSDFQNALLYTFLRCFIAMMQ